MKRQLKVKTLCESCAALHSAAPYPHKNATTAKKEACEICKTRAGLRLWIV